MKEYVSIRKVKAEPMTRIEAEKLLGIKISPAKTTHNEDGYLIEYEEGHKSWLSKMIFDLTYVCCDDFKERLKIEWDELKDRLTELKSSLSKKGFREKVGDCQYNLMVEQVLGMGKYLNALEDRMKDLGIIIPERQISGEGY